MLYVYALADDLHGVQGLAGVQGEALMVLALEGLMAIAGEVVARPAIDAATLKAQDALVRELHARAEALLPMRFGTTASNAADLQRALDAREGVIDRLRAVRGCEQMIVRVLAAGASGSIAAQGTQEPEAPSASPGRRYMESRAARSKPSAELAAIAAAGRALDREVRVEPAHVSGFHGSVYHLIERGAADRYRAAITRAAEKHGVEVVITGPSPPYAFA